MNACRVSQGLSLVWKQNQMLSLLLSNRRRDDETIVIKVIAQSKGLLYYKLHHHKAFEPTNDIGGANLINLKGTKQNKLNLVIIKGSPQIPTHQLLNTY